MRLSFSGRLKNRCTHRMGWNPPFAADTFLLERATAAAGMKPRRRLLSLVRLLLCAKQAWGERAKAYRAAGPQMLKTGFICHAV
jgi:hypothetical protein